MSRSIWIDTVWCLALCLFIFMGVRSVPLHGDESTLIFMGRDLYYHLNGDTERVFYREQDMLNGDEATEQMLRIINGSLPKYLFGAGAYITGYDLNEINQQWVWGAGWLWNHDNGHVPDRDLLLTARYISTALLALSAVVMFGIGYTVHSRWVGYIASGYYALNPAILVNGRRAMMEGSMLLFTLLAILIALWLLKNRRWWQYLLLGLVSGLAVASKHTSVVTIAAIFLGCGLYFFLSAYIVKNSSQKTNEPPTRQLLNIMYLFGAGILSIGVFFALNPAWWSNPVGVAQTVLEQRQTLLAGQIGFFDGYESIQSQVMGFGRQALVVLPMYAETDFDGFLSEQQALIQQYDASIWSGISLGGSVTGGGIIGILVMVGAVHLWVSDRTETSSALLITLWGIAMVILTLLTPLEWQRYYLPIYPVIGILGAIGLILMIGSIQQQLRTP